MSVFKPLPANPTNADLGDRLEDLHRCLEEHVKATAIGLEKVAKEARDKDIVLSGQITGINDQLDKVIKPALTDLTTVVEPIKEAWLTFKRREAAVKTAIWSLFVALLTVVATGAYTAFTTQHIAVAQEQTTQATAINTAARIANPPIDSNWALQRKLDVQMLTELQKLNKRKAK